MLYVCYVLAFLGLISFVAAALHIGHPDGGTYANAGSALLLFTTVLLLFRQAWRESKHAAP